VNDRRATLVAVLLLLLQPLLWLWPCLIGDRAFVPYDVAQFPPAALQLSAEQRAELARGDNKDVTEVPVWFLPELELARDELRAGRWPLWNPHARTGAPLHAHGLLGLCYPPNWVVLCADDPAGRLGWLAWQSLAIAGLLALGLLREVQLSVRAAWFGATLFQLAAPMAANGFFWMRLASLVWLPGLWWALLRLQRAPALRPGPFAAVAVTTAMPWLAGFPPYATATTVLGGILCVRLVAERLGVEGSRAARRLGWRLLAALACGALLAMPQVLPSLLFFPQSARSIDPSFAQLATAQFEGYGLLGYLLPDALGHPTAASELPYGKQPLCYLWSSLGGADGRRLEPNFNYTEYAVFFGTPGLLLAGYGAVRGRGHLRWFLIVTLLLLFGLALLLPGAGLLYLLPVVKNVFPMRWLAPATLPFAWLAAIGLDRLAQARRRSLLGLATVALGLAAAVPWLAARPAARHAEQPAWPVSEIAQRYTNPGLGIEVTAEAARAHLQAGAADGVDRVRAAVDRLAASGAEAGWMLLACGALLAAIALCAGRPRARRWLLRALLLLAVAELGGHGRTLLRGIAQPSPVDTPVHAFLRERAAGTREQGGFTIARGSPGESLPSQLPAGQLFVPGIRDLHVYSHADARAMEPLQRLLGGEFGRRHCARGYLTTALPDVRTRPMPGEDPRTLAAPPFPHPLQHPLLDLLGVRYVLATQPLAHAGERVGPTLRGPGGEFFVYERPGPLPRAFVVSELRVLPDDEAVLQALADPQFEPRARAFATEADRKEPTPARGPAGPARDVRFVVDHPTQVVLDVAAGEPGWLVLTDTFLPGWTATAGGRPVTILRGNHSQRLVPVPAEATQVCFRYAAPGLVPGLWLAAAATLGLLLLARRWRRSAPAAPGEP